MVILLATESTKTALKICSRKNYHSNKFLVYLLLGLENFLLEFHEVCEVNIHNMGVNFFIYMKEKNGFVEGIYQLKNFEMSL